MFGDADTRYNTALMPGPVNSTVQDGWRPPSAQQQRKLLFLAALGCAIYWLWPRPEEISPQGWRLFAIFASTICGLMLRPLPVGVLVLISLTVCALTGALELREALSGYANPVVWMVLSAFFISRALIKTGLARRIALFFVRVFGRSSIGISFSLILSDVTLATIIPSNTARAGGVILPITRGLAELYGSLPGKTAGLLGAFLMTSVYQGECVAAAMFLTGHAGNPLVADLARDIAGVEVSWASWALVGIVPGIVSILGIPFLVSRLVPLEIKSTPKAVEFAASELDKMGPVNLAQKIVLAVFLLVCGLWLTASLHGLSIALVAMGGACMLFLSGVLTWEDAISERNAWDVFVWYGGVVRLGGALNDYGVTEVFAKSVGGYLSGVGWVLLLGATLLIYFYAHYGFASSTMHLVSMFPPFVALLVARGAPAGLVVYGFACLAALSAGLTHYGTVPAPMFFAQDYVSLRTWWKVGFVVSLWNVLVWCSVGFAWWKVAGVW